MRHAIKSALALTFLSALALPAQAQEGGASKAGATPMPIATDADFDGLHVMTGTPDYVATKLGRLHYWSLGKGPTVILLHQGPLFAVEFAKIQPLLAKLGYRSLAVDIPGFGFSQRPDHPATGDEYADALATLLDHLGVEQAALIGTHTGATVALAFATHHPERTACLILQSVPVYSPEEFTAHVNAPARDTTLYGDGRHLPPLWENLSTKYDNSKASAESIQWLLIGTLLSGDAGNWYGESSGRTFISRAFDSAKALPLVKAPTLLVSVEGDHVEESVKRARAIRPDFAYTQIPNQHSIVTINHPDLWVDTVKGFVGAQCGKATAG